MTEDALRPATGVLFFLTLARRGYRITAAVFSLIYEMGETVLIYHMILENNILSWCSFLISVKRLQLIAPVGQVFSHSLRLTRRDYGS